MASKRTGKRRASVVEREWREVLRRAQAEVAELLKRNKAGTITQVQLQSGLKEVRERLKQMDVHFYDLC